VKNNGATDPANLTMLDLLITHATLPDGRTDMSLAVQDGRFVDITAGPLQAPAHRVLDAGGSQCRRAAGGTPCGRGVAADHKAGREADRSAGQGSHRRRAVVAWRSSSRSWPLRWTVRATSQWGHITTSPQLRQLKKAR
jgi:hypothetical protein